MDGSFGEVYKSEYRGNDVAVKTMKQIDAESLDRFQEEILLMSDLRHQNIVSMIGCCWERNLMALVMEFCEKGTSSEVLKVEGSQFSWDDPLLKWAKDTSKGMAYLHGMMYWDVHTKTSVKGVLHRDLKPDNCLVTESFGIRIADFGESRALTESTMTQVGTPMYVAPEVVKGEKYSGKADVFSFALTLTAFAMKGKYSLEEYLLEEFSKTFPQKDANLSRLSHALTILDWRPSTDRLVNDPDIKLPSSIADLFIIMWASEEKLRPSFVEIGDYLDETVRREVMDGAGGSGARRTSTSGGLSIKIGTRKAAVQAEEEGAAERIKELEQELAKLRSL